MFHSTWGHAITDGIQRIWFLKSELMNQFKNCPLVYLLCTKREIFTLESYKSFRRLLEILEVDVDNLRLITEPTEFDKIILPNSSFAIGKFTAEYRESINRIRDFAMKNRIPVANKKFYYFHGLRQMGEDRLAEYFKSKGYEIIQPENLTLDEQLNWLINCESFASTLGSASHNSLFLRDGTEAIFIPRLANTATNYFQLAVNQVNSVNANYIDSTLSLFGTSFYIISEQLKRLFGDKWIGYDEEDFKNFLQYVKDGLGRGLNINQKAKEYYDPVLEDFISQLKRREDLIKGCGMPKGWETFQPTLSYQTHVGRKGWSTCQFEEQISGFLEDKFDIQAVKINFPGHKVFYSVYYDEAEGWSQEVTFPEIAGTTGKAKSIYGMRVRLDEKGAKEFDILYRIHKFDGTWTPWAKNGEAIYSHGQKLSAIQIKLEPINSAETDTKKFDYTQTFWLKDDEIYLQGQRPQIN